MTERPLDTEPPDGGTPPHTPDQEPSGRRRPRWLTIGVPAAVVAAAAMTIGGVILADGSSGSANSAAATTLRYGTVAQTTVAQTQSLSGTIAYTATQTITNQFTPSATTASLRSGPTATAILAAFLTSTSGTTGPSGSGSGATGATGTGATGTGATGKGATGTTGKGPKGATGTTGKGPKGATGTTGKGAKRATGKGAKGATGASGSSSSSGSGASTSSAGTLTAMAAVGSTVKVGGTLYTVNQQPIMAMYGTLPAYRAMQDGDTGTDIRQLQTSLENLGYNPGTTDGTFGASTLSAVEAWQTHVGITVDGIVHLGQVVFVSGPSRVITQLGTIGEVVPSGSQILSVGPESPIVTASESSTQLGLLSQGQTADVQLPDNAIVTGKVTSVGAAASSSGGSGGSGGSGSGSSTTPVTIALNDPALGNSIAGSSVTVIVTTSRVNDVLAVPIAALVATSSGQFYVQVPNANRTLADVSVNPTVYDDTAGIVAVPGANLTPGQRVVVAQS